MSNKLTFNDLKSGDLFQVCLQNVPLLIDTSWYSVIFVERLVHKEPVAADPAHTKLLNTLAQNSYLVVFLNKNLLKMYIFDSDNIREVP